MVKLRQRAYKIIPTQPPETKRSGQQQCGPRKADGAADAAVCLNCPLKTCVLDIGRKHCKRRLEFKKQKEEAKEHDTGSD